jgi:hypothetical protein
MVGTALTSKVPVVRRLVDGAIISQPGSPLGRTAVDRRRRLVAEHAHLPHGLAARARVHAERGFDEGGHLDGRELALPDVEVDEVAAAGRQRRRRL